MTDWRARARWHAEQAGLPPDLFEKQIGLESAGYAEDVIACRRDSPAGARGIAQLMPVHWSAVDPCDPEAALGYGARLLKGHAQFWQQQGRLPHEALALALASYNAGRQGTIDGLAGRKPGWPFSETVTYLSKILDWTPAQARAFLMGGPAPSSPPAPAPPTTPAPVVYDATYPAIAQNDDWSCGPTALRWALHAFGRRPAEDWIEPAMIAAGVVSEDDGLLDASGRKLAEFVAREYGEYGYGAYHADPVLFDDVRSVAGRSPALIGGRRWGDAGHWSGVRGYDAARDVLLLANPADGWGGIGQVMGRQEFERLGPFSLVALAHESAQSPLPTDDLAALRAQVAQLTAELADKSARLDTEVSKLGYVTGDVADALSAIVETLRRLKPPAA